MHNLALIVVLAERKSRPCPCGAVADPLTGQCRKRRARTAWRRKHTRRRKTTRRRLTHPGRVRNSARFLADMATLFSAISIGTEA